MNLPLVVTWVHGSHSSNILEPVQLEPRGINVGFLRKSHNVFVKRKQVAIPMKGHGEHLKFKSQLYMCLPVLGFMASRDLAETKNDHGIMLSPSIAWCWRNLFQLLVLLNNLSLLLSLRFRSPQNFLDEIHIWPLVDVLWSSSLHRYKNR